MVVAVLVTSLFWVFARDSNGIIALCLVPVAAFWAWRPGTLGRPWALGLAGGLLAIFLASFLATTTDAAQLRRNQRPILHVIGRRVLVTPQEERFFREHGMPAPRRRSRPAQVAGGDRRGRPAIKPGDRQVHRLVARARSQRARAATCPDILCPRSSRRLATASACSPA